MKVTYDPETDTLTIRFNDSPITESDEIQEDETKVELKGEPNAYRHTDSRS